MGRFFNTQSSFAGMPYELKKATEQLMITKAKAEEQSLRDAMRVKEEAYQKAKSDESMSNSLARLWQSKIEGGSNVITSVPRKSLGAVMEGQDPEELVRTGVWQPNSNPYTGEIPAEAMVAYDKYMGLPVDTVHKERELKAKEKETAEKSRVYEETKLADIEYKKQALLEKEKEERQKVQDKNVGTMQTMFAKAWADYNNELDDLQRNYGNNPEIYDKEFLRKTTDYNDTYNRLVEISNGKGLVNPKTNQPYPLVDRVTGKSSKMSPKNETGYDASYEYVPDAQIRKVAKELGISYEEAVKRAERRKIRPH